MQETETGITKITSRYVQKYMNLSVELKSGLWFTICNFIQKGISFITIPIFTRIMSTTDYGRYSVYTSWYSLIAIFATLNLSNYVFNKGMVKYPDERNEFELSLNCLSSTITVAFIVIYFIFFSNINRLIDLTTPLMTCMLIQILTEPAILCWTVRNRFEYKYRAVVVVTLCMAILNPLLGILAIKVNLFDDTVFSRALTITIVTALFAFVILYKLIKATNKVFSIRFWKYALAFNLPLIPHFLSQTVLNQSDRIMIKSICNASDAAIYSVAYSVGMAVLLFSQAIQQTYLPWLYQKLAKNDYSGITKTANIFLVIMAAINLLIIAFSPEIITIVGSEAYRSSIWVMPPICGSVYFIFLQNLFANIEYYHEETKLIAVASVFVAVLNIGLNAIFIRRYGFLAAGYTTLICYIVHALVHYFVMVYACKKNKMEVSLIFDLKITFIISLVFCTFLMCMTILYKYTVIRYISIICMIFIAFGMRKRLVQFIKVIKS